MGLEQLRKELEVEKQKTSNQQETKDLKKKIADEKFKRKYSGVIGSLKFIGNTIRKAGSNVVTNYNHVKKQNKGKKSFDITKKLDF